MLYHIYTYFLVSSIEVGGDLQAYWPYIQFLDICMKMGSNMAIYIAHALVFMLAHASLVLYNIMWIDPV